MNATPARRIVNLQLPGGTVVKPFTATVIIWTYCMVKRITIISANTNASSHNTVLSSVESCSNCKLLCECDMRHAYPQLLVLNNELVNAQS